MTFLKRIQICWSQCWWTVKENTWSLQQNLHVASCFLHTLRRHHPSSARRISCCVLHMWKANYRDFRIHFWKWLWFRHFLFSKVQVTYRKATLKTFCSTETNQVDTALPLVLSNAAAEFDQMSSCVSTCVSSVSSDHMSSDLTSLFHVQIDHHCCLQRLIVLLFLSNCDRWAYCQCGSVCALQWKKDFIHLKYVVINVDMCGGGHK